MVKFLKSLFLLAVICALASCARGPKSVMPPPLPFPRGVIVHVVAPGETLWRIGKMYDVPPDTIMRANHIANPNDLKMGSELRIPNASQIRPVITLYPSKKWKYIIIHHSATEGGSSLNIHMAHRGKGWDSIGYHFVIDNGTGGKKDGQIETTPRWLKQLDGAHCKASDMNYKAIGICLVGNFDNENVSTKQMQSLVELVNQLRKYYKIPAKNILQHGKVADAATHCPGTGFPWDEFKRRLK